MYRQLFTVSSIIFSMTACADRYPHDTGDLMPISGLSVSLSVQGDSGGSLPTFPLNSDATNYRAYLLATPNERYTLHVTNNSSQRVGLVIAVDGRNIISGKQSWLKNNERMYVVNPYSSGEYEGWRTATDQVNRFYFTDAGDSYASAWGDNSAMGVIAMAVYAEQYRNIDSDRQISFSKRASKPQPPGAASESAGTGFGESTYSPSQQVTFKPLPNPIEKIFLKYEWYETLCSKKILSECRMEEGKSNNRFWPEQQEFAKPPPSRN